ncbi:hypothetical protein PRIPAC_83277 [Pristionchus pacificus]|uniref:Uncharacterized protein n=1 Tax=Pristionchus pacificus TaxID=54126 RepID=A0A2A6BV55_PRIPA|nr:hypothetical protein PRIPAC_83277 [Pristionchus pacificus]|eukprot:PDM69800.1 hypothetical protein PRIPAC_44896 [Pristionchus pacificus]
MNPLPLLLLLALCGWISIEARLLPPYVKGSHKPIIDKRPHSFIGKQEKAKKFEAKSGASCYDNCFDIGYEMGECLLICDKKKREVEEETIDKRPHSSIGKQQKATKFEAKSGSNCFSNCLDEGYDVDECSLHCDKKKREVEEAESLGSCVEHCYKSGRGSGAAAGVSTAKKKTSKREMKREVEDDKLFSQRASRSHDDAIKAVIFDLLTW